MLKKLKENLNISLKVVGVLWVIYFVSLLPLVYLGQFGIWPREVSARSLAGIIFAPMIHVRFLHLFGNSIVLFCLLVVALSYDRRRMMMAIAISWFVSGIGIWFLGFSGSPHIGASGVIMGLMGFLALAGYYKRDFTSIVVSAIVLFGFGGSILIALIPMPGISWMGHAFGFLGGALAAKNIK